ncbi:hypothetical protein Tco_0381724 [Tanacetum coccineum]
MKGSVNVDKTKNESNKRKFDGSHKNVENTVIGKSFVSVVKTSRMPIDKESPPAIVLEDDCLNAKDLTLSLMGRVKEMASLSNLNKWLCMNDLMWLRLAILENFGRLGLVELDGVTFKLLSGPTFKRIATKWVEDIWTFKNCFSGKVYWVARSEVLGGLLNFRKDGEERIIHEEKKWDGEIMISRQIMALLRVMWREALETLFGRTRRVHSVEEGLNEGNTVNLDMKDYGENERDDNSFVNLEDGKDNSESEPIDQIKEPPVPTSAPSTSQQPTSPPSLETTHVKEEPATTSPRSLEEDLKQTKKIYGKALTKVVNKTYSPTGEEMSEDIDQDDDITLVTPTKVSSQEDQFESHLEVLSAAKILVYTAPKIQTYTRRRRSNRPLSKDEVRKNMCTYLKNQGGYKQSQFKGMSYEDIRPIFEIVWDQNHAFVPIDSAIEKEVIKRYGITLQQRQKGKEFTKQVVDEQDVVDVVKAEEPKNVEPVELSQEELQKLVIIVPEEGMNVEALQVKYPIIDWEVFTEDSMKSWRIIRVGNHTKVYQVFEDMIKNFDRDDLVKLWSLVKERFSSTEPIDDKEKALWVELKRLFELDTDDLLELQRYMHDPLTWRLYNTCYVHRVATETGLDMFMLAERDYSLTRGLPMLMFINKLQVDQFSEMTDVLLQKIFILANRPRQ